MKKVLIVTLVIAMTITSFAVASSCFYPRPGYIRAVEYDTDLLYIEDLAGLMWIYEGVEDFWVEDNVAMLMFNNFTPNTILDDVIVDIG